MHYLFSLIIDRGSRYQGAARITICKCTHHTLLVIDHKKNQRLWHLKCVDTCKGFKQSDILGYNMIGFHTLKFYVYLPTKRTLDGMFTTRSAKNTVFSNSSC